jgi:hypothetical protein
VGGYHFECCDELFGVDFGELVPAQPRRINDLECNGRQLALKGGAQLLADSSLNSFLADKLWCPKIGHFAHHGEVGRLRECVAQLDRGTVKDLFDHKFHDAENPRQTPRLGAVVMRGAELWCRSYPPFVLA